MSMIVAVSSQKGGVAKTTSTMSLGAALAESGHRTLVVDLDPQAHLTLAAGLNADELPWTIADLLERSQRDVPLVLYPTRQAGLEILPADPRLAGSERTFYIRPQYEYELAQTLSPWTGSFDYILLDCPPALGALTLMALTAAHLALIPVQCEYFSTQGVVQLIEVIAAVRTQTNPALDYALFVTLFDGRNLVARRVLEQLRSHFTQTLMGTIIQIDTRLRECALAGEPVTTYAPRTRASLQYHNLAAELTNRLIT